MKDEERGRVARLYVHSGQRGSHPTASINRVTRSPSSSFSPHPSALINKRLEELIPKVASPQQTLYEAGQYAVAAGKRLRPQLLLLTVEAFGFPIEKAIDVACAIELIHGYSLVHDDLPCMDDDDFRRGRPTVHKVYGEGMAVLTGDYLLTLAFEVVIKAPLRDDQKVKICRIIAERAGGKGMVGGQVVDVESEGKEIDLRTLYFMHWHKTGALITAALECAGVICNVSKRDQTLLFAIGKRLGLAYQVADDIDDAAEEKEKATAITLLGIESAKTLLHKLQIAMQGKIQQLSVATPHLQAFINTLLK